MNVRIIQSVIYSVWNIMCVVEVLCHNSIIRNTLSYTSVKYITKLFWTNPITKNTIEYNILHILTITKQYSLTDKILWSTREIAVSYTHLSQNDVRYVIGCWHHHTANVLGQNKDGSPLLQIALPLVTFTYTTLYIHFTILWNKMTPTQDCPITSVCVCFDVVNGVPVHTCLTPLTLM